MGNVFCCCENKAQLNEEVRLTKEEDIKLTEEEELKLEKQLHNNFDIKKFNDLFVKRCRNDRKLLMTDLLDKSGTKQITYRNILDLTTNL